MFEDVLDFLSRVNVRGLTYPLSSLGLAISFLQMRAHAKLSDKQKAKVKTLFAHQKAFW